MSAWSDRIARWWAHRRLSRGRCSNCQAVLRDDETTGLCSDECAQEWQDITAY